MPGLASAQTPAACPTAPADYTGTDQTLDELRDMRIDAVAICEAAHDDQAAVLDALTALDQNITDGRVHSDVVPAKLDALHDDLVASDGTTSTVALSSTDRELATDAQLGLHSTLWLIAGLLVGLFAAARVWETFRP